MVPSQICKLVKLLLNDTRGQTGSIGDLAVQIFLLGGDTLEPRFELKVSAGPLHMDLGGLRDVMLQASKSCRVSVRVETERMGERMKKKKSTLRRSIIVEKINLEKPGEPYVRIYFELSVHRRTPQ